METICIYHQVMDKETVETVCYTDTDIEIYKYLYLYMNGYM